MGRIKKITDEQALRAFAEYERGCRLEDIAAVLEVSEKTLRNEFKKREWHTQKQLPDEDYLILG